MDKILIYQNSNYTLLYQTVNEFLLGLSGADKVVDIKYQTSVCADENGIGLIFHSVLIHIS